MISCWPSPLAAFLSPPFLLAGLPWWYLFQSVNFVHAWWSEYSKSDFFCSFLLLFPSLQPEHCLPQVPHPAYTGEHLLIIKVVQETRLRRHDIWFAIMMMAMIMVTIFMIMMTRSDNDVNQDKQKLSAQVSPAAQLHGSARPCIFLVLPLYIFCHKLFQFAKSFQTAVPIDYHLSKALSISPNWSKVVPVFFFKFVVKCPKAFVPIFVLLCLYLLRSSCSVSACRYSVSCLNCLFQSNNSMCHFCDRHWAHKPDIRI